MALRLASLRDIARLDADTLIDVRSPSEFAEDHVPGAINLPVLDDAERARVGTIYKQESPFLARKVGAALVARNAARHLEGPLADKPGGWRPVLYCWRGGQRSGSFAAILSQIGWRAEVIEGGYRSYRRLVSEMLYDEPFPCPVVLLDGNTGTGKTELLDLLKRKGVQTIDLEGLARHRGSLFGWVGVQPSQRAFESALAAEVSGLDPARPVVVEAESPKIGRLSLPPGLLKAMRAARRIVLSAPLAERAAYLVRAYGPTAGSPDRVVQTLEKLVPLQGREKVAAWRALACAGDMVALAEALMSEHYDPRYEKMRARHAGGAETVRMARLDAGGLAAAADEIDRRLEG